MRFIACALLLAAPLWSQAGTGAVTTAEWLVSQDAVVSRLGKKYIAPEQLLPFVAELQSRLEGVEVPGNERAGLRLWQALRDLGREESFAPEVREAYFEQAAQQARRFGHATGPANVGHWHGAFLLGEGRNREGLDVLDAAIESAPKGLATTPWLHHLRAEGSRSLGRFGEALRHVELGVAALTELHEAYEVIHQLPGQRAQIYLELGLIDLAAPIIEELAGLAHAARANGELGSWIAQAFVDEASLALFREGAAAAEPVARAALADAELMEVFPTSRAGLRLLLAHALVVLERRDPERAREAQTLLTTLLDTEGLALRMHALAMLQLAASQLDSGEHGAAAASLATAREAIEVWGGDAEQREPVLEVAELSALEARLAIEGGASAAELAELQRRLERACADLLELWELTPLRAGGVGFLGDSARRAILSESFRADRLVEGPSAGALRSLERLLEAQSMSTDARLSAVAAPTVEELRSRYLTDGHGMLFWLPAALRSHVFALDQNTVVHVELPPRHLLDADIERYMGVLGQPPWSAQDPEMLARSERRWARRVSRDLLPDEVVALIRGWSAVTVVGADLILDVPFEALPVAGEEFLGAWRALDYLPSALWATRTRDGAMDQSAPLEFLVLHSPQIAPSTLERWPRIGRLGLPPEDLEALERPFGRAVRAGGHEANVRRLVEGERARALCVVTHGVSESTRERPAGLLLSPLGADDDGVLWTSEIDDLPPYRAELVVLAACKTDAGPARVGDYGAGRMGSAWLRNGARAVIHSGADLALEPTLALLGHFFERVRTAGDSPAEALRLARATLASGERWAAPFYHSRVRVDGHGHGRIAWPAPPSAADEREAGAGDGLSTAKGQRARWPMAVAGGLLAGYLLRRWMRARSNGRRSG